VKIRYGFAMAMVLLALTACAQGDKPAAKSTTKSPGLTGKTLIGKAHNAKGGAVVVTDNFGTVYIDGLDSWPDELLDRLVEVTGTLKREKRIPDPVTKPSGEVSAGAYGDQTVVYDAQWKPLDE
jgi:hypothetical protein